MRFLNEVPESFAVSSSAKSYWVTALLQTFLVAGCGGGGSDSNDVPTITVAGQLSTAAGIPVPNVQVSVVVTKVCVGTSFPIENNWFGKASSDALGNYVAVTRLDNLSFCTFGAGSGLHVSVFSCSGNKQIPCYVSVTPVESQWGQSDFSARTGVDFVVAKRARILGTVQFPNGTVQPLSSSNLGARITPDPNGGQVGRLDSQGAFFFAPLPPGTYTASFPPAFCSSLGHTGCNGVYDFTPSSMDITIVSDEDVDIAFTAIPH